ncbi:MAG TPA: hypothetical protein VGB23_07715, partial [Nitrospirota bacterium]
CGMYVFILLTGSAGIVYSSRNFALNILLGFTVFFVMIHILSHGGPRYRLPAMPAMLVFSALALQNMRCILEVFKKRPFMIRNVAFVMLAAYFVLSAFLRIGFVLEKYWYA